MALLCSRKLVHTVLLQLGPSGRDVEPIAWVQHELLSYSAPGLWELGKEAEEETSRHGRRRHDAVKEGWWCAREWAQEGTGESSLNSTRNQPRQPPEKQRKRKGRDHILSALSPGPIGSSDKRLHSQTCVLFCQNSRLAPRF